MSWLVFFVVLFCCLIVIFSGVGWRRICCEVREFTVFAGHLFTIFAGQLFTVFTGYRFTIFKNVFTIFTGHLFTVFTGYLFILFTGCLFILFTGYLFTVLLAICLQNLCWPLIYSLYWIPVYYLCWPLIYSLYLAICLLSYVDYYINKYLMHFICDKNRATEPLTDLVL